MCRLNMNLNVGWGRIRYAICGIVRTGEPKSWRTSEPEGRDLRP